MSNFTTISISSLLSGEADASVRNFYNKFVSTIETVDICGGKLNIVAITSKIELSEHNSIYDIILLYEIKYGELDIHSFAVINCSSPHDEIHIEYICAPKRGAGGILLYHIHNIGSDRGKKYISLNSIIDKATFDFYINNGFYINRPIYNYNQFLFVDFKEVLKVSEGDQAPIIECILNNDFNDLTEGRYVDLSKLATALSAIYLNISTIGSAENIDANDSEQLNSIINNIYAIDINNTNSLLENMSFIYTSYRILRTMMQKYGLQPRGGLPTWANDLKSRYNFNELTLIPMIKSINLWPGIVYHNGKLLTKSKSRYYGKSDADLLTIYSLYGAR